MKPNVHRARPRAPFAAAVAVACLVALVVSSRSATADTVAVANPTFQADTAGWHPSRYATVKRVVFSNHSTAGQVTSRSTSRSRTIGLASAPSAPLVEGTYVHVAGQVATSQVGHTVTFQLREVDSAGSVLRTWTDRHKVGSKHFFWLGAHLTTKYAGSRVSVYVKETVAGKQWFRLRGINQEVTPPADLPTSTPSTPPTSSDTLDPSVAACQAIDYKDPAQGVQTYADEFDGTALDPTMWRIRDNTFLDQDAAFIDKDNVSVHDGYLDIMGRREDQARWRTDTKSLYGDENRVRKYSTGYVDSIKTAGDGDNAASPDRFSQQYGYFEARMLVPSTDTMSQGIWPAFWLRADHQPGEIDVMESYGAPTSRSGGFDPSPSYEWNSWQDTSKASSAAHFLGRPVVTEPIHKAWHTFGVNWSPTCLRYTLDDRTVGIARPIAGEVPYLNGDTFDSPFHLRFNMQVGSKYWGWPDPTVTRDEFHFKVDYVRVWQKLVTPDAAPQ